MCLMVFEDYFAKAHSIAEKAHAGQKDIAGEDYIKHPIKVSSECDSCKGKIVALLHDVVEDSDITIDDIRAEIPDEEILTAIVLLTKTKKDRYGDGYVEYLTRIKNNDLAREVKIADLQHNMILSRLPVITDRDLKRQKKYQASLDFLKGVSTEYKM